MKDIVMRVAYETDITMRNIFQIFNGYLLYSASKRLFTIHIV